MLNKDYHTKKIPASLCRPAGTSLKTAATYSPTVTQYHRRDEA